MGLKFRKSFKIAPGVKVNVGKKSAGVSIGGKYGGISMNTKTGTHARVSAPGTGLSYTTKVGGSSNTKTNTPNNTVISDTHVNPKNKWVSFTLCLLFGYFGVHKFYEGKIGMGLLYLFTIGLFGFGWFVDIFLILGKENPYYV